MKNIEREFSEISDALVTAYQNWEIWWLFKSERPKYANIMNHYLGFFTNAQYAHWITTIISTWCLIDDNNLSLVTFYKRICKENILTDETRKEIENKFDGIDNIMKGIKIIRHNVIAHISNKIDTDEAFTKANLCDDDFRDIIVELGNIFNKIRIAYGKNQLGFWLKKRFDEPNKFIEGDAERMLQDLLNYNSKTA